MELDPLPLEGTIALVTERHASLGRAIAIELGALGAAVYGSGRSTRAGRSPLNRPETMRTRPSRHAAAAKGSPFAATTPTRMTSARSWTASAATRAATSWSTTSGVGIRSSSGTSRCGNTHSTRPSASCATASRRTDHEPRGDPLMLEGRVAS